MYPELLENQGNLGTPETQYVLHYEEQKIITLFKKVKAGCNLFFFLVNRDLLALKEKKERGYVVMRLTFIKNEKIIHLLMKLSLIPRETSHPRT